MVQRLSLKVWSLQGIMDPLAQKLGHWKGKEQNHIGVEYCWS